MNYIFCFLLALVLSLVLTPLARTLSLRVKKLHVSSMDRWNKRYISKAGGIVIFIVVWFSVITFLPMGKILLAVLTGGVVVFFVGLVDDLRNLKPQIKLMGELVAASLVVSLGVTIWSIDTQFSVLSYILLVIWIVGITNAFNLLDNMDGLAAGIAFIVCIFLSIYNFLENAQSEASTFFMLALAGASLGFLRYNFKPAKIYMGDSGSLFLGYIVGVCSVINTPKIPANLFLILLGPVIILIVPIFDTVFVMATRSMNKRSMFQGGSDHTSHRVVKLGLSEEKAVGLFYLISIFFGIVGVIFLKYRVTYMHMIVALPIVSLIMFGLFLAKAKVYQSSANGILIKKKALEKNGIELNTFFMHKRRFLEVFIDFALIFASYTFAFYLLYGAGDSGLNDIIIKTFPLVVVVKLATFTFMKVYKGFWRYVSLTDLITIFKATVLASVLSFFTVGIVFGSQTASVRIMIIDWMVLFLCMEIVRGLERVFGLFFQSYKPGERNILIFGAGDAGVMVLKEIRNNEKLCWKVAGFLDDDYKKKGQFIEGVCILGGRDEISKILTKMHIDEIIVAISNMPEELFNTVAKICAENNIACRKINKLIS